jgi:hypothetical protein
MAAGVVVVDGGLGFGTVEISPIQNAATDRTRLSSSGGSLAFSSPVSVAAIGPAVIGRLCRRTRRIQ